MSTFLFKATDKKDKLQTGELTAASENEAETLIRDKGLKLLVLREKKAKGIPLEFGGGGFPANEKVAMCRYLSLMINAGIPLGEGFDLMINGTDSKTVREVLQDVSNNLRQGKTLHYAFSKYPKYFSELFLTIVKTGETSGSLSESFAYLSKQLKQEQRLKQRVLSSLLYPFIILGVMGVIGIIVFAFVLPNLANVFLKLNIDLPLYTRLLFTFSLFLQKNLLFALGGFFAVVMILFMILKSKKGKDLFYNLLNHLPLSKKVILEYNLVRFNQSLSALLSAGVSITEAIELAVRSLSFVKTEELIKSFNKRLTRGMPLSSAFAEVKLFPKIMVQMVAVGERTGSLDKTLAELAEFYQEEVENSLKNLTTALEPILMVIVGVGVGVMVISIISPIYGLISKLQTAAGG